MPEQAISSSAESYLRDYHDRRPGETAHSFGGTPATRQGKRFASSYASLADVVPAGGELTVLDLACGDGFLLAQLAARAQPGLRLAGVDFSAGELAQAHRRLGDNAQLMQGRAQALPLRSGSVDVVLCHMALMLLDDIEQVVREIARVLRPGGRFSAVVGGGGLAGPAVDLWLGLLREAKAEGNVPPMGFGDPRARSPDGLRALLGAAFGGVEVHDVELVFEADAPSQWDWMSRMYDVDQLPAGARERMRSRFIERAAPLAGQQGMLRVTQKLRQATATARAPAIEFAAAGSDDAEALVALRIAAMRESLEQIGRFDAARARERFLSGFSPESTRHIVVGGERVGFVVVKPQDGQLLLDHLYVDPAHQRRGIGAAVLASVFAQADVLALPLRVGALRGSDSNRFYRRHGFELVDTGEWDHYYVRRPCK